MRLIYWILKVLIILRVWEKKYAGLGDLKLKNDRRKSFRCTWAAPGIARPICARRPRVVRQQYASLVPQSVGASAVNP